MSQTENDDSADSLRRELGLAGATFMGLGAILGSGVFISIGIAAGVAGPAVVPAIALAALVALCNALSSAQLAAAYPISGGTYEYGYRVLRPWLGFSAGWMFLCAKSASAATAALGFAGYLLVLLDADTAWRVPLALAAVIGLTGVILTGMRRSNHANTVIVTVTLCALSALVLAGVPELANKAGGNLFDFSSTDHAVGAHEFLSATALMFVAFTGYGRIATLGEEVRDPRQMIPRAIITTLAVSAAIYVAVAVVAVGVMGAGALAAATHAQAAPLQGVAERLGVLGLPWLVAIGAIAAMLGVLLNLILGLSRVLLAMGRRRDMPGVFDRLDQRGTTPYAAVLGVTVIVVGLTAIGNVETTWAFSAFTVLIYYAITNLAALRLPDAARLYSRVFAWLGLVGCLGLAFWVDRRIWLAGVVLLLLGLLWHGIAQRLSSS